ncbi:conserved hypothetical protein [Alteromonas macleodii]|uniref:hypothetical protein n=1 Tax=Alteromonas mediterranea TaxID=314275 RepID=UPI0032B1C8CA|tara:strand:- start:116 stop:1321 length:1206 start_codon:yes stop_codon:yes gene_type:complete
MALIIQRPQVAYVRKKDSSEYEIDRSTGKLLQVNIEKAIRVKLDDPDRHKKFQYWSLNPDPKKRYRLKVHTVNQQFERYKKGDCDREFDRNYDESMTHKCVVEALSRLTSMTLLSPIECERSPLEFDFESVRKEPFLHLPNNSKYYPDILCTFSEEHEMYDRWGGKIAIEVTYSHGCESYKLEDFIFHNIPVFEVTIEEGSARQFPAERPNWPKGQPWGHQLVEAHINNLLQWFAKGIVGQLKVDPVSTRIYDKDSALWLEKEEILKQKIFALEEDIKVSRSEAVSLATLFKESLNSLASAKNKIEKIDSINESLRTNNAKLSLSLKSESERTVDLHSNVDLLSAGQDVLRWRLKLKGFFVYILATVILGTLLMPLFFPDISRDLLNSWYGGMLKLRSIFE